MPKVRKALEPQQERSRESLRRLLKAVTEVLGQHGVEGTTIPRIAHHAGLTPGAIYRRFQDKDALLETAILRILERQEERMKIFITPETAAQIPLAVFADQVIGGMVITYRANAPLLRAIRQFVQGRANTRFGKQASKLEMRSFERVVNLFLAHSKQIKHPDPRAAVSFGMLMIISTLYELVVLPQETQELRALSGLIPKDDQGLRRELTRAFLSYLSSGGGKPGAVGSK